MLNFIPKKVVPHKFLPVAIDTVKKVTSSRPKLFNEGGKRNFAD
jgi:hypothetical protein